jgi:hypothetical protein
MDSKDTFLGLPVVFTGEKLTDKAPITFPQNISLVMERVGDNQYVAKLPSHLSKEEKAAIVDGLRAGASEP